MEEILKEWDLDSLIPTFTENEIDLDNICKINDEQIKELIPKIGIRLKFISKLQEYKSKKLTPLDIDSLPVVFVNDAQSPSASGAEDTSDCTSTDSQRVVVPTINRSLAFCGLKSLLKDDDKMPNFDPNTLLSVASYGSLIHPVHHI